MDHDENPEHEAVAQPADQPGRTPHRSIADCMKLALDSPANFAEMVILPTILLGLMLSLLVLVPTKPSSWWCGHNFAALLFSQGLIATICVVFDWTFNIAAFFRFRTSKIAIAIIMSTLTGVILGGSVFSACRYINESTSPHSTPMASTSTVTSLTTVTVTVPPRYITTTVTTTATYTESSLNNPTPQSPDLVPALTGGGDVGGDRVDSENNRKKTWYEDTEDPNLGRHGIADGRERIRGEAPYDRDLTEPYFEEWLLEFRARIRQWDIGFEP